MGCSQWCCCIRRKTYTIAPNFYITTKNYDTFLYNYINLILQRIKNMIYHFIPQEEIHMKTFKKFFQTKSFTLQTLSCLALTVATLAANSRCVYIYHNPKKPNELQQLKKF